jgi:hypothetical protein
MIDKVIGTGWAQQIDTRSMVVHLKGSDPIRPWSSTSESRITKHRFNELLGFSMDTTTCKTLQHYVTILVSPINLSHLPPAFPILLDSASLPFGACVSNNKQQCTACQLALTARMHALVGSSYIPTGLARTVCHTPLHPGGD